MTKHDDNQEIFRLIGHLANGLRQALNPMQGFLEILRQNDIDANERAQLGRVVEESLIILQKMARDMNELSLFETMPTVLLNTPVVPAYSCRHLCDIYQDYCKEGVQMVFNCHVATNVVCHTNLEALKLVTQRLIENALYVTRQGQVTLTCEDNGDYVRFSVADNGSGVPAEYQDNIFELHANMDEHMKRLGMGIIVCRTILRRLGGRIWLDKTYGSGTRFQFEIPKRAKSE